jgi:hypothetical protein
VRPAGGPREIPNNPPDKSEVVTDFLPCPKETSTDLCWIPIQVRTLLLEAARQP